MTENFIKLFWNTENDIDYSILMIAVNETKLINVSYHSGEVIMDVTEYLPDGGVQIEMYGVNSCGMVGNATTLPIGKSN